MTKNRSLLFFLRFDFVQSLLEFFLVRSGFVLVLSKLVCFQRFADWLIIWMKFATILPHWLVHQFEAPTKIKYCMNFIKYAYIHFIRIGKQGRLWIFAIFVLIFINFQCMINAWIYYQHKMFVWFSLVNLF